MKKLQLGPRDAPRRTLTKLQAIRHLIHSAVRLIVAGEDPFATHMLIQSAEKLLIDLAKHRSPDGLAYDQTTVMKPEYKDALLAVHRETFNYFKHADRDYDQSLHVGDIARSNILQLGVCICNYSAIAHEFTDHMRLGAVIARTVFPDGFVNVDDRPSHDEMVQGFADHSLRDFFSVIQTDGIARQFPNLATERTTDLQDVSVLLDEPIAEIHKG